MLHALQSQYKGLRVSIFMLWLHVPSTAVFASAGQHRLICEGLTRVHDNTFDVYFPYMMLDTLLSIMPALLACMYKWNGTLVVPKEQYPAWCAHVPALCF